MNQDPESLLEVDRIDEVLEAPDPPQSVVVVQYRTSRLPWVLLIGAIVLVPLICGVIYYRINEGLRNQAALVARDMVKQWEEQKRLEADAPVPIRTGLPVALASTSVPAAPTQGDAAPAPASGIRQSESGKPNGQDLVTKPVESTAAVRSSVEGPAPPPPGAPASGSEASPPMPAPRDGGLVAAVRAPGDAARSPFGDLGPSIAEPAETPFGANASRTAATARQSPETAHPVANPPPIASAPAEAQPDVATAASPDPPSPSAPSPDSPIAAPTEPPLPSREETERQIHEEAAQKEADRVREIEQQRAEDRRLQYDERARFHQELREALIEKNRSQAAMAIDQLCQKFNFKLNPVNFALAREKWNSGGSLAVRANLIRRLDLPRR